MTQALVVHGTGFGGAADLAVMIGAELSSRGLETEVLPAGRVAGLAGYDTVIIAAALRAGRWARDARRLVQRRRETLRRLPVWLVAGEPGLDAAALAHPLMPAAQLAELAELVGARAAVTFEGGPAPLAGRRRPAHLPPFVDAVVAAAPPRVLRAVPAWGSGAAAAGGDRSAGRLRLVAPEPGGDTAASTSPRRGPAQVTG
ncbi:flavodoxin domain-containing protein [Frankia sp. AgB32]|uniref:flavodoxin domain-containing protein n=1 Tax=Frankia sp. AgB32 TaxID=631119 RepID=UPI00200BB25B|nr:flavodoxin domain-containing protein [Frankia sp. AgB32]MCK9893681.1 flavodoxin domain-containing protein [Frankia sp. AgB32]